MPFTKGQSGNANGKPKGSTNISGTGLQGKISKFLEKNIETVFTDFDSLPVSNRVRLYCELLRYSVPKLGNKPAEIKFENLSDEQLKIIVTALEDSALPSKLKQYELGE